MTLPRLHRWVCRTAVAIAAMHGVPSGAQLPQPVDELRLKAALVYNFALFTDWPQQALADAGHMHLCVSADGAMRPALMELNDRFVKGHRIVVRGIMELAAARNCHLLFLDGGDRERWSAARNALRGVALLTISDDPEIARAGAAITLYPDNNRIAFDVDMQAVRESRLGLSSKLLRLAKPLQ